MTITELEATLKPCLVCGKMPAFVTVSEWSRPQYQLICNGLGVYIKTDIYQDPELAAKAWNERMA